MMELLPAMTIVLATTTAVLKENDLLGPSEMLFLRVNNHYDKEIHE